MQQAEKNAPPDTILVILSVLFMLLFSEIWRENYMTHHTVLRFALLFNTWQVFLTFNTDERTGFDRFARV